MTDDDQRRSDEGLPTAGRKPAHTGGRPPHVSESPPCDDDGPTLETAKRDLADPDGPTRPLTRPAAAAGDPDEPTRPLTLPAASPADPEEPTRPLTLSAASSGDPDGATLGSTSSAATVVEPGAPPHGVSPDQVTPTAARTPEGVRHEEPEATPPPQPTGGSLLTRRPSSAGVLILVLVALFGFTLVVQLRSNDSDGGLVTARQEDLVRILSDLEARDSRLQSEISALETSQRQLTSGVVGRQAALEEAEKRADELGLLAGTVAGRGPGLRIAINGVKASAILNTVQELRGAGGEVMQIAGVAGQAVRIVASSYFVDAEGGGIIVDGDRLTGPYVLTVIGVPQVMQTALQIPGGVVASVNSGGGSVTLEQRTLVEVTAVRDATTLQYARPAS